MRADILIFDMTAEDIPTLVEIEKACFAHPWTEEGFKAELTNKTSTFLTARFNGKNEENGKIVGYIGFYIVCGDGYVDNIAVLPEYQGQGIGHTLMTAALEHARAQSASFLSLEVRPSNVRALSLYSKLGFKDEGRRKNFYTAPKEDALIMTVYFDKD